MKKEGRRMGAKMKKNHRVGSEFRCGESNPGLLRDDNKRRSHFAQLCAVHTRMRYLDP
jgi:hypothetical protein